MSTTTESRKDLVQPSPPRNVGRRPRRRLSAGRRNGWRLTPYLLIAPAIVFELIVHVIPMVSGAWASFISLNKNTIANWTSAPFIGLTNFEVALNPALLQSLLVTCAFTILSVGFSWLLGMAGALALQKKFVGRGVLRALFLVPYALPIFAGVIAWKFMFQKDIGAVNSIIVDQLGLLQEAPFWLLGDNAFFALVIVSVWNHWPFAFLMLMAGLQSVPQELYEAASIDGAGYFRQWRAITLPMLRPVNIVLLIVTFLWTFNNFNVPFLLFGGSRPPMGELISFRIYNEAFLVWNFGVSAAMAVLLLVFLAVVTGLFFLFVNRRSQRA